MNFKLRTIPCKIIAGWTPDKGGYKQLKLFGKVVFQYSKFDGCSKIEFFPHRQRKIRSVIHEYDSTMFFKVNRVSEYSILCIRTWMDIAEAMNSLVVIICDNPKLEKKIFENIWFKDPHIQIVTSERSKFSSSINNIASRNWRNAAYAHFTPLYYARLFGITKFWSIDADDTMFLCENSNIVDLLQKAMSYAEVEDIDLFSLDMWKSRSYGKHWSWGVTYVRDTGKVYDLITQEKDASWIDDYKDLFEPQNANSDWHINNLVSRGFDIKVGSFYPKETGFIHWGDQIFNPVGSYICKWEGNYVCYPIMKALNVEELSRVPINSECVGFEIGVDNMRDCYLNKATWLKWASPVVARYFGLENVEGLKFER